MGGEFAPRLSAFQIKEISFEKYMIGLVLHLQMNLTKASLLYH